MISSSNNEQSMFYGALPQLFEKAGFLRRNPTKTENILWKQLHNKKLGVKFRRQHPIFKFIADFYCHEKRLVIEIDGDYHTRKEQIENDQIRTEDLKALGIEVLRFTDQQVLKDIECVIKEIKEYLGQRTPPNPASWWGDLLRRTSTPAGGDQGVAEKENILTIIKYKQA
jgi:imidazole glycerol-phosphate synthase subunit HisF